MKLIRGYEDTKIHYITLVYKTYSRHILGTGPSRHSILSQDANFTHIFALRFVLLFFFWGRPTPDYPVDSTPGLKSDDVNAASESMAYQVHLLAFLCMELRRYWSIGVNTYTYLK